MRLVHFGVLALGVLAACTATACGSPNSPRKTFVFTPVPFVTATPEEQCKPGCGSVIAVTEKGSRYYADAVLVLVENDAVNRVEDLIEAYGFEILKRSDLSELKYMFLRVPAGSALAVAEWIKSVDGVHSADLNLIFMLN
jgi:hypothetical protein